MNFLLTSSESELLLQFEQFPSLEKLAKSLCRDPTAISRQLKRISEKGDFLVKVSGRWKITDIGMKFNQATKDYLLSQEKIVKKEIHLKIGSTREFCSRILAPSIKSLQICLGADSISLISLEGSVEKSLLSGKVDLAFDCGRPYSPDIVYKQLLEEPIAPVVSSKIYKAYSKIKKFKELENYPHILCDRLHPDRISTEPFLLQKTVSYSNDIAVARQLCLSSQGWALLPIYTIREELKFKKLKIVSDISFSFEKFGVWFLRERKSLTPFFNKAVAWSKQNEKLMMSDLS